MLTLIIIMLVIVIPLLLLVSFDWAPPPHTKKQPLENRKAPAMRDELTAEESEDSRITNTKPNEPP
jgi:hypothetical protein